MDDNAKLIVRLLSRDEAEYKKLFDRTFATLHRQAAIYLKDSDAANDIVQEVYISLYEKPQVLSKIQNLDHYLRTAVRNRCYDYLRSLSLEDRSKRLYYEEWVDVDEIDEVEREKLVKLIRYYISLLPPACKNVCELRFIKGYKVREIAKELDISESTVKTQLSRGIRTIREQVSSYALTHPDNQIIQILLALVSIL
jgi:RNA polymerase sigma-70 factor (ECF subfamily)